MLKTDDLKTFPYYFKPTDDFAPMETMDIRVVIMNEKPWFVAKDVCDALEIANPTQAVRQLDDDERSMFNIGRQGDTWIINEPGLYSLILRSRKPEAKKFKRWVTHEVLPTIRKTGGTYMTDDALEKATSDPDFMIGVLQKLKEIRQERDEAIRTKSWISDKKTASAMGTASAAKREVRRLKKKYEDPDYKTVRAIVPILKTYFHNAKTNNALHSLIGRDLRRLSDLYRYPVKSLPDNIWGTVRTYHRDVIKIFLDIVQSGGLRAVYSKHLI